jgi:NADP-dependent 3-hydroxy acid dehydrogenase YdfG
LKNNPFKLVVAITGATSGIGKALAKQYLAMGAQVAVCARSMDSLQKLDSDLNSEDFIGVQADVSQKEQAENFIHTTISHFGKLDILINNAGISMRALVEDVSIPVLQQLMDVNYWGMVYCTKAALKQIKENKGTIAGISSIAGNKGLPGRSAYSSSKFAMQGFLESLRIELLPTGANVMWISPGFTASNIRNTALAADGSSQGETPLQENKLMSAEECAELIIKAVNHRKRSVVMTRQGKLLVWLNKFFPKWADKMVYNHFKKEANSPLK